MRQIVLHTASWSLLGLACIGCSPPSKSPVAPVEGTVTYDGEPLSKGLVTFVPDVERGTSGPIGVGEIREDGTFRILTDPNEKRLDGALIGHHKIRVIQSGSDYKQFMNNRKLMNKPGKFIPLHYFSETTSGLSAEIKPGQTNVVDLKLHSTESAETPSKGGG